MAGLTDTGLTIKNVDEVLSDMESEQLANIDANLNVEADSVLGQLNGIYAGALAEAWELLEQVYQAAYPDTASGQPLSYIAAMTGAIRLEATKSQLYVKLEGTVDTVVPSGTQGYVDGDADHPWETTADATIEEQGATDYVAVVMDAVNTGPETDAKLADVELVISTPVSGLDAITILTFDALVGRAEETDSELRQRREQTLALAGASTVDAIRAEMLQVTGVDSCTVFENPTGLTDANGIPPYAIEVLVNSEAAPDYVAQDIRDAVLLRKPGGTETYGGISGSATDAAGNTYTVEYSEPTTVRCWVEADLTAATDGTYVGDANAAIAVATWATQSLLVGQDIFASDIINVLADLEGVISVDISAVFVDDDATPDPSTEFITTPRQLVTIDSDDVTITS